MIVKMAFLTSSKSDGGHVFASPTLKASFMNVFGSSVA
jgi:hypothetical protein